MCEWPRCSQLPVMSYINKPLCAKHWRKLCDAGDKESEFLAKIGLIRTESGSVIKIDGRSREYKNAKATDPGIYIQSDKEKETSEENSPPEPSEERD